jgi:NADH-quinone oxidoreductase subunit N
MMNEYSLAAPEIYLASAICVVLLVDVFLRQEQRGFTYLLSMLTLVGAALVSMLSMIQQPTVTFSGSFISDPAAGVLKMIAYMVVALVFVYSRNYLEEHDLFKGEFFILSLFGLLGIMVMISANSMLIMYLGLELLSLSLYALVAFNRDSAIAAESAMKYFVLGAIASGTLLYGISLLYGVTGALEFSVIAASLTGDAGLSLPAALGLVFVVVGVAFKFGAVPFHMWLPDVYEGAPTPVTLFIGSAPKIAAFALTWRVLTEALGPMGASWQAMLVILCVLSLLIGNIVAIAQTNLKRMLAYSTISHVGFILMGFIAGTEAGVEAAMFYTLTYVLMAAAAFGMIIVLSRRGFEAERLEDFKGLNQRSPWFALMMLLIMLSMAGVPPLVGFFAKLAVLSALVAAGQVWLVILGVVLAVVGAFYYLRIIWFMYFADPVDQAPLSSAGDLKLAISVNSIALLALGLFPGYLLNLCAMVL